MTVKHPWVVIISIIALCVLGGDLGFANVAYGIVICFGVLGIYNIVDRHSSK